MKSIFTIVLCLCSFILAQCDEGEVELWPDYYYGGCFDIATTTSIDFSNYYIGINDVIPSEIGQLINLEYLNLSGGYLNISGSVPSEIANLENLTYLNLANNQLDGSIPSQIGNLTNLEWLNLSYNNLSGNIPTTIGDMLSLQWLELGDNNFDLIPSEIGNLNQLKWLYLHNNNLTDVPSEIGNLSNLKRLDFSDNDLQMQFPSWLTLLNQLEQFSCWGCQLTGSIPSNLVALDNLWLLNLGENQLSGNIPDGLGSQLNILYLNNNNLSGPLPVDIFQINEGLDISNNQLTGELTEAMFDHLSCIEEEEYCFYCWYPYEINISNNQLSGTLPSNICNLKCSDILYLANNQFCDPYPNCGDESWDYYLTNEDEQNTSNCQLSSDFIYLPEKYSISNVYPNPFNPSANFQYEIPDFSMVDIFIYDLNGRVVEQLVSSYHSPGIYNILWDASNFSSGIYILSMQSNGFINSQKISLTK